MVALLMVAGAVFVFLELVRPEYVELEHLRGLLFSKKELVEAQEEIIAEVSAALSNYEGIENRQEVVSLALPLTADQGRIFYEVQKLAEMNTLSMQAFQASAASISPENKRSATFTVKPFQTLNFQIRLVGTYENFKKFLEAAETNVRILDIKSVSIEPIGRPNQDFYTFILSAATYYQPN